MMYNRLVAVAFAAVVAISPGSTQTRNIPFQAALVTAAAQPAPDGEYEVRFRLYAGPTPLVVSTESFVMPLGGNVRVQNYPLIPESEEVTNASGNLVFARGTHYTIDYGTGQITGTESLPPNITLVVTYSWESDRWEEAKTIAVANGIFQTNLGDTSPLPHTIPQSGTEPATYGISFSRPYWVGVKVGEDPEMTPLLPLSAVPYAQSLLNLRIDANTLSPNIIGGGPFNTHAPNLEGQIIAGGGTAAAPNTTAARFATVLSGSGNHATGGYSVIVGGSDNQARGNHSTVLGGWNNVTSGAFSTAGGTSSEAGSFAIALGLNVKAIGSSSVGLGSNVNASHYGSFVFGDGSTATPATSSAENEVTFRAAGGMRVWTNSNMSLGVQVAPGGGSWSSASDREMKDNITPVDGREILEKVADLQIARWNYKAQDPDVRHIGPMSQDFMAAFGVGESDKHITAVDADGVALVAIQGLYQLLKEKDAELAELRARLAVLEAR
jgi:hypothetical protein